MAGQPYRGNAMAAPRRAAILQRAHQPERAVNWQAAPCTRLPADWWDTGNDGNRFAMTLCRVACPTPVRARCEVEVVEPAGIVRAGTAYTDRGHPCRTCACGRPITRRSTRPGSCWACAPTAPHIRLRRPGRPRRPAPVS